MSEPFIEEPLRALLQKVSKRVVVVGSVARGVRWPKDLDLLWDLDSDPTRQLIRETVRKLNLEFESPFIGSWTFRNYGWMVEIISMHYGPDYRVVRRKSRKETICGIEFFVAQPEDSPKVVKSDPTKWVTWKGPEKSNPGLQLSAPSRT